MYKKCWSNSLLSASADGEDESNKTEEARTETHKENDPLFGRFAEAPDGKGVEWLGWVCYKFASGAGVADFKWELV